MCGGGYATIKAPSLPPVTANWEPVQAIGVTKISPLDPLNLGDKFSGYEPRFPKREARSCPRTPSPSGRPLSPGPGAIVSSISSYFGNSPPACDDDTKSLARRPTEKATSGRVQNSLNMILKPLYCYVVEIARKIRGAPLMHTRPLTVTPSQC